jgi:hypothetical protein
VRVMHVAWIADRRLRRVAPLYALADHITHHIALSQGPGGRRLGPAGRTSGSAAVQRRGAKAASEAY